MVFVTDQDIDRLVTNDFLRSELVVWDSPSAVGEWPETEGSPMGVLQHRLIVDGVQYRLRSDGSAVSDIIARLESGELPGAVVGTGAVTPADLIAALAHDALG